MKPKDKIIAAINHKRTEKFAVALHNFLLAAELMEMPYPKVFQDSSLLAQSQLKAQALFGHDLLMVECGVATLAQACGCEVEYADKTAPWISKRPLEGLSASEVSAKIKNMDIPDPKECNATKTVIDAVKILVDKKGDELFIMGRADQGPFSLAAEMRGMSSFLMDLALGESYIEDILNFTSKAYVEYAGSLMQTGCDGTSMGESLSGPDVVAPDYYRRFAKSYEKQVIEILHEKGNIVANHICGNVDAILDDMVETNADILEIDEKTNLELAEKKARGKTCLLGQISPGIFRNGSVEDVINQTKLTIDIIKDNPGFIMAAGCALSGDTPVDNVKAFVKTVREAENIF